MRSRRILVLGAGPAQLGLLEAARVRGFHVVAVDRDPGAPGFRFAHERALIPSFDDEEAIERLAATQRIEGVIAPGIDYPVAVAARIAERLGLPHPLGAATALLVTSKLLQRERFAEAGIPQPRFRVCAGLEDAREAVRGLGLPCIVKPPDQQGQRGLGVVRSASELTAAFEHALETARGSVVLVEELVEGREVTVNAFSAGGRFQPLTVTDRVVADPPAFGVALAHIWPSELGAGDVAAAIEVARTAAKALGVRDGPTYTQVLIGTEGPRIGELAARLGGGHDAELCKAALGVDLNGLALAVALGESIPNERLRPRREAGGACVRFLVPPAGTLESVEGVEAAEARDGVLWVHVYRRPGHTFGTLRHGSDRAGALLAVGETREQALVRADDALECVQLVTTTAQTEALR